jgi:hypothetical protein
MQSFSFGGVVSTHRLFSVRIGAPFFHPDAAAGRGVSRFARAPRELGMAKIVRCKKSKFFPEWKLTLRFSKSAVFFVPSSV